jgi:hypothetical protein
MNDTLRLVLALTPLACYFFILGVWRSGRSPRVVPGPLDFGLLAMGLGGLIAFGPIGSVLIQAIFPGPSIWAWLALAATWALFTLLWLPRTARRLVVYNVESSKLNQAVRDALMELPGSFAPTLTGFEDAEHGRGVAVGIGPRSRTGLVEAYGSQSETLTATLGPCLRERLRGTAPRSRSAATLWFALSTLTLLTPLTQRALGSSPVGAALRVLIDRFQGG